MKKLLSILPILLSLGCYTPDQRPSEHAQPLDVNPIADLPSSFAHAAMGPLPQCLGADNPNPCGRTIIARGSLELRPDGSVEVYNASGNVLGAAYTGGGKVQVLMSETTAAEYQVLLSGSEEVPSGRTPQIGRFDKWARYFRITPASPITCKQWIDFVVVGR